MYIREIILEGFKTYQNRTEISGFDSQFNAITGLNGSGKSNILDGIQFLLGSNCKEMLRLKSNLSELIYKDGYAGITKATVAIRFACPDRNMRPTGYEDCDELLVTRQISKDHHSKFFINGNTSNLSKVKNLFRSVSLNIQNPHFLVKQGQITKIINLKPVELLGMIEETAGTAYYNKIRQESENMMNKKKDKLRMIEEILRNSIEPQMRKLRKEREQYQAWKAGEGQLKAMGNILKWHEVQSKDKKLAILEMDVLHAKNTVASRRLDREQAEDQLAPLNSQIAELRAQLGQQNSQDFLKLKSDITKKDAQRKHIEKRSQTMKAELQNTEHQLQQDTYQVERAKKRLEWVQGNVQQIEKQIDTNEAMIKQLGSTKGDSSANQILQRQCSQYENKLKIMQSQLQTLDQKQSIIEDQRQGEKRLQKELQHNRQKMVQEKETLKNQLESLRRMEPPIAVSDPDIQQNQLSSIQQELSKLYNSHYMLKFSFKDPYNGFNRSSVKGRLFMLFRVRDKLHEKAIELGVGGKLTNVVVDDENTGKTLIDGGCFGQNISIIPNSKVVARPIAREIREQCINISRQMGGLALPASELVEFSKELEPSIMYGLGNFVVCSNGEIARKIAFHSNRNLRIKCVTYDGDIIDPSGTLTGGFYSANNFLLTKYSEVRRLEATLQDQRADTDKLRQSYDEYRRQFRIYQNVKTDIQTKQERLKRIDDKLTQGNSLQKQRNFEQQIKDISARKTNLKEEEQIVKSKLSGLKKDLSSGSSNSAAVLKQQKKALQQELEEKKSRISKDKKQWSHLEVLIDEKLSDIKGHAQTVKQYQTQIYSLNERHRGLVVQVGQMKAKLDILQQEYQRQEKQASKAESKLRTLSKQIQSINKVIADSSTEIKRADQIINEAEKQIKQLISQVKALEKENEWVRQEGAADTIKDYDPNTFNFDQATKEFNKFKSEQQMLKKSVNFNVENNSEKTEQSFKELLNKQRILETDKLTLVTNIRDLDVKRKETLQKCFEHVKGNLQKIFTDLLPGAVARLKLIDPTEVTLGCEMSVEFDKVKKSLNELSGGQRSLLALSFILSLLLYKPSPFYILDEIDSALDQSHTENIGYMISQRFPQSQFLIISLKQGMFNNANVLFKVSFLDGESKVERQQLKIKRH